MGAVEKVLTCARARVPFAADSSRESKVFPHCAPLFSGRIDPFLFLSISLAVIYCVLRYGGKKDATRCSSRLRRNRKLFISKIRTSSRTLFYTDRAGRYRFLIELFENLIAKVGRLKNFTGNHYFRLRAVTHTRFIAIRIECE